MVQIAINFVYLYHYSFNKVLLKNIINDEK